MSVFWPSSVTHKQFIDGVCYNRSMTVLPTLTDDTPPRWDMSVVYPSLESLEFANGFTATVQQIRDAVALFDAEGIAANAETPATDDVLIARFERILAALTRTQENYRTLSAYISAFVATNSR